MKKKRSIGSKVQKKTNKITKFGINAFFIKCGFDTYKNTLNTLLINLVTVVVLICAFESIDLFFSTDRFFCFSPFVLTVPYMGHLILAKIF